MLITLAKEFLDFPGLEGPSARLLAWAVGKKYGSGHGPLEILAAAAKDAKTDEAREAIGSVWADRANRLFTESQPQGYERYRVLQKAIAALDEPALRPHAAAVVTDFLEKSQHDTNLPTHRTLYTILDVAAALKHENYGSERIKNLRPKLSALLTSAFKKDADSLGPGMNLLIEAAASPILGKASYALIMEYAPKAETRWPSEAQAAYEAAANVKGLNPVEGERAAKAWKIAVWNQGQEAINAAHDAATATRKAGTLNGWIDEALKTMPPKQERLPAVLPKKDGFRYDLHH